jgi:hypothetical protein
MNLQSTPRTFQVYVNGQPIKKHIEIKANRGLGALWTKFNKYAKGRGFDCPRSADALGYMAWVNESDEAMTIVEIG